MGRNAIPKLNEWRNGERYSFNYHGSPYSSPTHPSGNGQMVTFNREDRFDSTILGSCYADGFEECMASMWQSGYFKGEKAGYEKAKREIRSALGID